jgi:DNA topoisomerase-1
MRDSHVTVRGASLRFEFRGKSGRKHAIAVNDARLARIVRQCRDLPGRELFQYVNDDGRRCDVTSADVNAYLEAITGERFTAKDFRTWSGTVLAATALRELEHQPSRSLAEKNVVRAVEAVAGVLGNTRAVCRQSYIHPAVLEAYMKGSKAYRRRRSSPRRRPTTPRLRAEEALALAMLDRTA